MEAGEMEAGEKEPVEVEASSNFEAYI